MNTIIKEKAFDYPNIDFVLVGEGEQGLYDLLSFSEENRGTIEGLIWRNGKEICFNGYRKNVQFKWNHMCPHEENLFPTFNMNSSPPKIGFWGI